MSHRIPFRGRVHVMKMQEGAWEVGSAAKPATGCLALADDAEVLRTATLLSLPLMAEDATR